MNKETNTLEPGAEIRALWWKQPFATLMLHGKIETRIWSTEYRGLVLICASKKDYSVEQTIDISGINQHQRILETLTAGEYVFPPNGVAIAVGRLVDCRPMTKGDEAVAFVQYREPWMQCKKSKKKSELAGVVYKMRQQQRRLYCHVYEDVRAIEPFELSGQQGWLKLNTPEFEQSIISKIKFI